MQVTKQSQKLQKATGDPLTCIETTEGKNSHVLETCGRQGLQHGQGQSIQSHGHVDDQRVEAAGRTHGEGRPWQHSATVCPRHREGTQGGPGRAGTGTGPGTDTDPLRTAVASATVAGMMKKELADTASWKRLM